MFRWLGENYQWLFSGAGVTAIVVIGAYVVRKAHPPTGSSTLHERPLQAIIDEPSPSTGPRRAGEANLRPKDILKEVGAAPLLQVEDVRKHFEGLRVTWPCVLVSASKNSDGTVRLHLCIEKESIPPLVVAAIDPANYPGIGLLREKHKISVTGTIAEVDTLSIRLTDCTISFAVGKST